MSWNIVILHALQPVDVLIFYNLFITWKVAWPPSSLLHSSKNVPVWLVPVSFGYDEISIIDEPILHPLTHCGRDNSNGLMQKRRNSSALAMELRLFCIKPLILSVCPANERWLYTATLSLIGSAHAENAPCCGLYMTLSGITCLVYYLNQWWHVKLITTKFYICNRIPAVDAWAPFYENMLLVIEVTEKHLFTKFKRKFSVITKHTQGSPAWHDPVLKQLMVISFPPPKWLSPASISEISAWWNDIKCQVMGVFILK